jgi:hypothetical protein
VEGVAVAFSMGFERLSLPPGVERMATARRQKQHSVIPPVAVAAAAAARLLWMCSHERLSGWISLLVDFVCLIGAFEKRESTAVLLRIFFVF